MKAYIEKHSIKRNEQGLITKELVVIHWEGKPGFGQLLFKYEFGKNDNNTILDTECMDFEHVVKVLGALE